MRARSQRGHASVESVGLIALVSLSLAGAGALADPPPVGVLVDRLLAGGLSEFLAYRASPDRDPRLDFSTDECTAPLVGNSGESYDFTAACLRHDFGYRNLGRLGTLDDRRREVDDRFLDDMRRYCLTRAGVQLIGCLEWASVYHRAVRWFGWIPALRYR